MVGGFGINLASSTRACLIRVESPNFPRTALTAAGRLLLQQLVGHLPRGWCDVLPLYTNTRASGRTFPYLPRTLTNRAGVTSSAKLCSLFFTAANACCPCHRGLIAAPPKRPVSPGWGPQGSRIFITASTLSGFGKFAFSILAHGMRPHAHTVRWHTHSSTHKHADHRRHRTRDEPFIRPRATRPTAHASTR